MRISDELCNSAKWAVMSTPTATAYSELQQAFDHFNGELFDGELPSCLITLQRKKRTMGYFSKARFVNHAGDTTDEIAMNPTFFATDPLTVTLSTLVHEMCHQWQDHFGTPSRACYHNKEWGNKMEMIGLMPSHTGKPRGKKTGQQMDDYPIEAGCFQKSCEKLITKNFQISWMDRFADRRSSNELQPSGTIALENIGIKIIEEPVNRSNRVKYAHDCLKEKKAVNIWGKPELNINCGDCGLGFTPI